MTEAKPGEETATNIVEKQENTENIDTASDFEDEGECGKYS